MHLVLRTGVSNGLLNVLQDHALVRVLEVFVRCMEARLTPFLSSTST